MNRYYTVTEKQMRRLVNVTNRFKFTGCLHGDAHRYTRTNGHVDVLYNWVDVEDLPRSVAIKPIVFNGKPSRFYTLRRQS